MELDGYSDFVEIGRGGYGVVYRATQTRFGRTVAVKVLPPEQGASDERARRFERECLAVGGLSWHPRVVPVYDAGHTASGQAYLAMEYLPGGSLAQKVTRDGPLPWPEAVAVAIEVADALEAAHRHGVLHRDVKPENVLVGNLGEHRLADFGIAAITSATATATAALMGTASYLAPELLSGERATTSSDVYATAASLFALIDGNPPFHKVTDDTPLAAMMRAATGELPDLEARGLPADLVAAVRSAMAKDPVVRTATAAALIDALHEVQRAHGHAPTPVFYDRDPTAAPATEEAAPIDPAIPLVEPTVAPAAATPAPVPAAPVPEQAPAPAPGPVTSPEPTSDPASTDPSVTTVLRPPQVEAPPPPPSSSPPAADAPAEPTERPPTPPTRRNRRRVLLVVGMLTLLAIGSYLVVSLLGSDGNEAASRPKSGNRTTTTEAEDPAEDSSTLPLSEGVFDPEVADFGSTISFEVEGHQATIVIDRPTVYRDQGLYLQADIQADFGDGRIYASGVFHVQALCNDEGSDGGTNAYVSEDGSYDFLIQFLNEPACESGYFLITFEGEEVGGPSATIEFDDQLLAEIAAA